MCCSEREENLFLCYSLGWSSCQLGSYDVAEVNLLLRGWSIFWLSTDDNRVTGENLLRHKEEHISENSSIEIIRTRAMFDWSSKSQVKEEEALNLDHVLLYLRMCLRILIKSVVVNLFSMLSTFYISSYASLDPTWNPRFLSNSAHLMHVKVSPN